MRCWGKNDHGQLGTGGDTDSSVPQTVVGINEAVRIVSAGYNHTCALTVRGSVKCWGMNDVGQLGNGDWSDAFEPQDVFGLSSGVVAIAAGGLHTCALLDTGRAMCWGTNNYGQIGNGSWLPVNTPRDVATEELFSGIATGRFTSCAIRGAADVWCWGWGQGNNCLTNSNLPYKICGNIPSVAISVGDQHMCISTVSDVSCFGSVSYGIGESVTVIASGGNHACYVTKWGGVVKCSGANEYGQLGTGDNDFRSSPVDVVNLMPGTVLSVTAGWQHTCVLLASGRVRCWGSNDAGQLGNGTVVSSNIPVDVVQLNSFTVNAGSSEDINVARIMISTAVNDVDPTGTVVRSATPTVTATSSPRPTVSVTLEPSASATMISIPSTTPTRVPNASEPPVSSATDQIAKTETPMPLPSATPEITGGVELIATAAADISGTVVLSAAGYTLTVEGLSAGGIVTLTPGAALSATQLPTGTLFVLTFAAADAVTQTLPVTLAVQLIDVDAVHAKLQFVSLADSSMQQPTSTDADAGAVEYVLDALQRYAIVLRPRTPIDATATPTAN